MDSRKELIAQIDAIFHPESIAIVGLPRGFKMGKLFLIALRDMDFPGTIYPVHPEAEEIDGLKAYPSVSAIPGPVDLAIILVPHHEALPVVKQCAEKGVKGAVLFTSGYKETGTEEGKAQEEELLNATRSSSTRLFGPNCMGLYSPKAGLSFFPGLSKTPGPVGFISHSGSLANIIAGIAPRKGIRFSKSVSIGNECDLNCSDLLTYLGDDSETNVIGAYLEGIKDGPYFLDALKAATRKKPVIVWRVGLNSEGSHAASSHTGALAGSRDIWDAVARQGGAIPVVGIEALIDNLMGFALLPDGLGDRIAILSGPGGLAVGAAEACGNEGLRLAELSSHTRSQLSKFVAPTGTSLANPVDVGLTASIEMDIYIEAALSIASDPQVDALVVIGSGLTPETNERYLEGMIQARKTSGKPFLIVDIPGLDPALSESFCQAGIPFFDSAERAMNVYSKVRQYQVKHKETSDR